MEKGLMRGAMLLTITSLIVKILSAIYRVPFQNLVGDEGFYVYQQVYPIYGIAMTLSLSGLPVFVSKLIAEKETEAEKEKVMKGLFPLVFSLSFILFVLTFTGHQVLANWMGDPLLSPLIKMVSWVFLLTPILTCYRGYYQGNLLMAPTAYSQLIEQVLRVGMILVAAAWFVKAQWSIYQMGTVAMSGAIIGGVGALLILWVYRRYLPVKLGQTLSRALLSPQDSVSYLRRFLVEGGLICGYSSLLLLFQLVDSFVIKNSLVQMGYTHLEAKVTKGIYDRGQPLVQVGLVIAVALTTSFLPTLRKYYTAQQFNFYQRTVATFLRVSLGISSAATIGLIFLLPDLNRSLFGDHQEALALSLFMGTVWLMSLVLVLQTICQSRNTYRQPLLAIGLGLIVKLVASPFLTVNFGTVGASLATLSGLASCLVLLIVELQRSAQINLLGVEFIWKLSKSLGMMVLALSGYRLGVTWLLPTDLARGWFLVSALGGVLIGGGLFCWALVRYQVFTLREWLSIPLGKRFLRIKK